MGYFWVGPLLTLIGRRVGDLGRAHVDRPSGDLPLLSCKTEQYLHVVTFAIHPARVTCANCHAKVGQLFPRIFSLMSG